MLPDTNRERALAMSYDAVIRKDKVWNGLGNSQGMDLIPAERKLEFPGIMIPERDIIKLPKQPSDVENKNYIKIVEGENVKMRKNTENIQNAFKGAVKMNIPSIHQNFLLNNAGQKRFNSKINKKNGPMYNVKVKTDIHGIQTLPKDLVFQPKYPHVRVQNGHSAQIWKSSNGRIFNSQMSSNNEENSHIKPVRNMQLGEGQMSKIPQHGNVVMLGNIQSQNYRSQRDQMKFPPRPRGNVIIPDNKELAKPPVIEIFPRKDEPIRIHMYMEHKGNFSYHHVNLLWEDGQRHPVSPLILQRNGTQRGVAETGYKNHDSNSMYACLFFVFLNEMI
jgi:hypothetical protein